MPKQMYLCDMCGSTFLSRDDAVSCENRHTAPSVIYDVYWAHEDYPTTVVIKMQDGELVKYGKYREDLI